MRRCLFSLLLLLLASVVSDAASGTDATLSSSAVMEGTEETAPAPRIPQVGDSLLMSRIFAYKKENRSELKGLMMNVYMRQRVRTLKKNRMLILVPTMYALAKKKDNDFINESYSRLVFRDVNDYDELRHINVGTVPRYKRTLPTMVGMLTPTLYDVTLMQDHLLSPFHRKNKRLYRYGISALEDGRCLIAFVPKTKNTQTVTGTAVVEFATGRIESVDLKGEYDMISFRLTAQMGALAPLSLLPSRCDMTATFHMAGNRIEAAYHAEYGVMPMLPDSIVESHSLALMDSVRPVPLPSDALAIYERNANNASDSVSSHHHSSRPTVLELVGNNLVNRIKGNFGPNDAGMFKIYPILDPLSISYSQRKGVTYKFRVRGSYAFTPQQELSLFFRGGYSFKQEQFYFRVPVKYTFDKRRNGYAEVEVGNGNRINNRSVRNMLIDERYATGTPVEDSLRLERLLLDDFKDTYVKLTSNYDISKYWSMGVGLTYHRRSAVSKHAFREVGLPTTYHSLAPTIETQLRPWAWRGPILTINYEQGIRGLAQADMKYGRLEADAIWLRKFHRLRSLSMRVGGGLYTMKDRKAYFLDFENFRDDNMPGGWGDDWTGEFQLLKREQYNSSEYYVRSNLTYESPLFFLSHAPLLGKYVEMERIYLSTLFAKGIHPYNELGYGFTNRLFSIGFFVATLNGRYDGIGCRVGLELFRDW